MNKACMPNSRPMTEAMSIFLRNAAAATTKHGSCGSSKRVDDMSVPLNNTGIMHSVAYGARTRVGRYNQAAITRTTNNAMNTRLNGSTCGSEYASGANVSC